MSAARFFGDDHAPGINFTPDDEELVELYLLPRVRGEPDPFPGLIIDDDEAATTQPWTLFSRHHLPQKDALPAFFYVRTPGAKPGVHPVRRCDGGGTWKSQRRVGKNKDDSHALLVGGEKIQWIRHNLNFNMGSGSIGWVMREYSIPVHPSLKVCRISFSGHGQKRTRVPDGSSLSAGEEPAMKRARVADAADSGSASWTTTTSFDQEIVEAGASGDQEPTQDFYDGQSNGVAIQEQTMGQPPSAPQEPAAHAFFADQDPSSDSRMASSAHGGSATAPPPCYPFSGTTTTFVQDLGAAQALLDQDPSQNFSEEEIENMMGVLTDPNWTWEVEPYPNRQQKMDDCSLAAMQTPCFFAPDDNNSASSASASCITTTRTSPDHDYLQQTSQDQGIAEMVAEMTDADGQLDLVPPMAMMEQHVDQEPGMSNGSGYMDLLVQGLPNVATGTQGVLDSEGIDFLLLLASASAPSA
jgi:hypothetical protein